MMRHLEEHPNICVDGHPHRNECKIAYCWCNDHRGYLTAKLLKEHMCLEKQCCALQRLGQPYWDKLDAQKALSAKYRSQKRLLAERERTLLNSAREYLSDIPDVYVTTVKLHKPGLFRITFIGKSSPGLYGLADYMKSLTHCGIWLHWVYSKRETLELLKPKNKAEK